MKVLLLFSGQIRPIDPEVFNKSLLFFIGDNEVDVSLTYWNKPGYSMNHNLNKNLEVEINLNNYIEKAFKNTNIISNKIISENELTQYKIQNQISNCSSYNSRTKHSVKQLFMIYKSITQNYLFDYDVIVRCRYDSVFLATFEVDGLAENFIYNINNGNAYYPNRIYDIFFYGTPKSFDKLKYSFLNIENYLNSDFDNGLDKRDACRLLYLSSTVNGNEINDDSVRYCDIFREDDTVTKYMARIIYLNNYRRLSKMTEEKYKCNLIKLYFYIFLNMISSNFNILKTFIFKLCSR